MYEVSQGGVPYKGTYSHKAAETVGSIMRRVHLVILCQ
jgi:hypothetical protein